MRRYTSGSLDACSGGNNGLFLVARHIFHQSEIIALHILSYNNALDFAIDSSSFSLFFFFLFFYYKNIWQIASLEMISQPKACGVLQ